MKAEDTVMKEIEPHWTIAFMLRSQAEISFKAGREREHKAMTGVAVDEGNKAFKDGEQAGIREVVEWLETYHTHAPFHNFTIYITEEEWQAKLKEWGGE